MLDLFAGDLGAAEGLAQDALVAAGYYLVHAVCADFFMRLGRHAEARGELERAAALTQNERERALLLQRAAATDN